MFNMPIVSVVIAVYNGEKYLRETLESLCAQTLEAWECWIVDDGSNDATVSIVETYCQKDKRFRLIKTPGRQGPYIAANLAFPHCAGKYIARTDADDISLPERFSTQVSYMELHPEIKVCGGWHFNLLEEGGTKLRHYETDPVFLRWQLLFRCTIVHSTMMLRKDWFESIGYYPSKRLAQDWYIWQRAAREEVLHVICEPLILWRIHAQSITKTETAPQFDAGAAVACKNMESVTGDMPDYDSVKALIGAMRGDKLELIPRAEDCLRLITKLFFTFETENIIRTKKQLILIRNEFHRIVFSLLLTYYKGNTLEILKFSSYSLKVGQSRQWYKGMAYFFFQAFLKPYRNAAQE